MHVGRLYIDALSWHSLYYIGVAPFAFSSFFPESNSMVHCASLDWVLQEPKFVIRIRIVSLPRQKIIDFS